MRRFSYLVAVALLPLLLVASQAGAAEQSKPAGAKPATSAAGPATPVNLNTATLTQLQTLPGIGARTAEAIVEHRQKSGGFKKIEELMNVEIFSRLVDDFELRRAPVGLPRLLEVSTIPPQSDRRPGERRAAVCMLNIELRAGRMIKGQCLGRCDIGPKSPNRLMPSRASRA